MKVFIDFDDVIFNTRDFIAGFKEVFFNNSVSEEDFSRYYYGYPVKGEGGRLKKYDPWQHVKTLSKEAGIDGGKLKNDILLFLKDANRYVFPDTEEFLKSFGKDELFLISYGRNDFQLLKIAESGVKEYFKKIIVTDKDKSYPLERMVKKEDRSLFFLEDRVEQIESVKKKLPNVITILVKRKEGRYGDKKNEHCDHMVSDLAGALTVIKG